MDYMWLLGLVLVLGCVQGQDPFNCNRVPQTGEVRTADRREELRTGGVAPFIVELSEMEDGVHRNEIVNVSVSAEDEETLIRQIAAHVVDERGNVIGSWIVEGEADTPDLYSMGCGGSHQLVYSRVHEPGVEYILLQWQAPDYDLDMEKTYKIKVTVVTAESRFWMDVASPALDIGEPLPAAAAPDFGGDIPPPEAPIVDEAPEETQEPVVPQEPQPPVATEEDAEPAQPAEEPITDEQPPIDEPAPQPDTIRDEEEEAARSEAQARIDALRRMREEAAAAAAAAAEEEEEEEYPQEQPGEQPAAPQDQPQDQTDVPQDQPETQQDQPDVPQEQPETSEPVDPQEGSVPDHYDPVEYEEDDRVDPEMVDQPTGPNPEDVDDDTTDPLDDPQGPELLDEERRRESEAADHLDLHDSMAEDIMADQMAAKRRQLIDEEDQGSEGNFQLEVEQEERERLEEMHREQMEYEEMMEREQNERRERIRAEMKDKEEHDAMMLKAVAMAEKPEVSETIEHIDTLIHEEIAPQEPVVCEKCSGHMNTGAGVLFLLLIAILVL